MKKIKLKTLTHENFHRYGSYADLLAPDGDTLSPGMVEFYRDLLPLPLHGAAVASVTKIDSRPMVVDKWEYHTATGEAFLPLDGDIAACFIPAGKGNVPDVSMAEAFMIPRGTLIAIQAGVWHQAPYTLSGQTVHNLVLLPERTYANDCFVAMQTEDNQIKLIIS